MVLTRKSIGQAVRASRQSAGLTLSIVAGQVGVSPADLASIERGSKPLDTVLMRALARVIGVPMTTFFRDPKTHQPFEVDPASQTLVAIGRQFLADASMLDQLVR
jgi:transcriptional regulator with XRE-family HTH domain